MIKKSWAGLLVIAMPVFGVLVWMCGKNGGGGASSQCSKVNFIAPDGTPTQVNIDYSVCNQETACEFEFKCENKGNIQGWFSNFKNSTFDLLNVQSAYAKDKKDAADNADAPDPMQEFNLSLSISSLETLDTPAILQSSPGIVQNTEWYKPEHLIPCKYQGSSVKCTEFAPIADHTIIQGLLDGRPVKLEIRVDTSVSDSQKAAAGQIKQCGQFGLGSTVAKASDFSTLQRMYDCSKQVTDFGGYSNADGSITRFSLGSVSVDASWFLVACPSSNLDKKDQCSWLTPVFDPAIKFLDNSEEYLPSKTDENPTRKISSLKNKRILISGELTEQYNFFEINGKRSSYDDYPYVNGGTSFSDYCQLKSSPQDVLRSCYTGPYLVEGCNAPISDPYPKCTALNLNESEIALYNQVKTNKDICATMSSSDIGLLPDAGYDWEVPNYPIFLLLTGGVNPEIKNAPNCENNQINPLGIAPARVCLGGPQVPEVNYNGLRAVGAMPGFRHAILGSSFEMGSLLTDGTANFGGISAKQYVRCFATQW